MSRNENEHSVPFTSLRKSLSTLPSQLSSKLGKLGQIGISASANHLGRGDSNEYSSGTMSAASSPRVSRTGSTTSNHNPNTTCEYCGNSYLTMSEMRTLQTKVRDQEERLKQLKEAQSESSRLKETMTNVRKMHRQEISKRDEECQRWVLRCTAIENELERLKDNLKSSEGKNADLAQKYAIASEDFKQQEELICQLRSQLQKFEDTEAESNSLRMKNISLEENLQKLLQEIKSLRGCPPNNSSNKNDSGFSTTEIALRAKISDLMDRCSRITNENNLYQQEITNLLQKQPNLSRSDSPKPPSKISSVVSVEVHDLKRENAMLTSRLQAINDEHSNCQDMHAFLRESIEKLKGDNARLLDEMNSSRVKYEESMLKIENFQAVISGYQAERNRFMASYKDQQNKLEQLAAQNRAFHKSADPKLIEQLKSNVTALERQIIQTQQEKDKLQQEFSERLSEIQREVTMEKERADSCLTQSLTEREEVEKRWQERWSRHHSKLNDQLEILKTNYEGSLKSAKERELALQQEIKSLQEKINKYNKNWDDYREKINQELQQWKFKVEELDEELANTQKGKVDVEVMFQAKTIQLEELHETLRQGIEERQELQKRKEALERTIQEAAFSNSAGNFSNLDFSPSSPTVSTLGSPTTQGHQKQSTESENAVLVWKQSQNFQSNKKASPRQQQQLQQQNQQQQQQQQLQQQHQQHHQSKTRHVPKIKITLTLPAWFFPLRLQMLHGNLIKNNLQILRMLCGAPTTNWSPAVWSTTCFDLGIRFTKLLRNFRSRMRRIRQ
ncbi:unnamed protein product [Allacma fusca]|uniref:Uncharacterized protein n=1 Tax=Allacma fusca TaxID=39272 RepID=A0A8J2JKZ7_9HEXA|nr:unnamed protein product [Allacma fusca]